MCEGLLCFLIQSAGCNCQTLLGRDWTVRELNEMITWQKNEDSKQWSLGKEYLVSLFKPELLFVNLLRWLTSKTVEGKAFFLPKTLSLLVWEGSQSLWLISKAYSFSSEKDHWEITFSGVDRSWKQDCLLHRMKTPHMSSTCLFSRDLLLSCGTVLISLMAACIWMWWSQKCHCAIVTCVFSLLLQIII